MAFEHGRHVLLFGSAAQYAPLSRVQDCAVCEQMLCDQRVADGNRHFERRKADGELEDHPWLEGILCVWILTLPDEVDHLRLIANTGRFGEIRLLARPQRVPIERRERQGASRDHRQQTARSRKNQHPPLPNVHVFVVPVL